MPIANNQMSNHLTTGSDSIASSEYTKSALSKKVWNEQGGDVIFAMEDIALGASSSPSSKEYIKACDAARFRLTVGGQMQKSNLSLKEEIFAEILNQAKDEGFMTVNAFHVAHFNEGNNNTSNIAEYIHYLYTHDHLSDEAKGEISQLIKVDTVDGENVTTGDFVNKLMETVHNAQEEFAGIEISIPYEVTHINNIDSKTEGEIEAVYNQVGQCIADCKKNDLFKLYNPLDTKLVHRDADKLNAVTESILQSQLTGKTKLTSDSGDLSESEQDIVDAIKEYNEPFYTLDSSKYLTNIKEKDIKGHSKKINGKQCINHLLVFSPPLSIHNKTPDQWKKDHNITADYTEVVRNVRSFMGKHMELFSDKLIVDAKGSEGMSPLETNLVAACKQYGYEEDMINHITTKLQAAGLIPSDVQKDILPPMIEEVIARAMEKQLDKAMDDPRELSKQCIALAYQHLSDYNFSSPDDLQKINEFRSDPSSNNTNLDVIVDSIKKTLTDATRTFNVADHILWEGKLDAELRKSIQIAVKYKIALSSGDMYQEMANSETTSLHASEYSVDVDEAISSDAGQGNAPLQGSRGYLPELDEYINDDASERNASLINMQRKVKLYQKSRSVQLEGAKGIDRAIKKISKSLSREDLDGERGELLSSLYITPEAQIVSLIATTMSPFFGYTGTTPKPDQFYEIATAFLNNRLNINPKPLDEDAVKAAARTSLVRKIKLEKSKVDKWSDDDITNAFAELDSKSADEIIKDIFTMEHDILDSNNQIIFKKDELFSIAKHLPKNVLYQCIAYQSHGEQIKHDSTLGVKQSPLVQAFQYVIKSIANVIIITDAKLVKLFYKIKSKCNKATNKVTPFNASEQEEVEFSIGEDHDEDRSDTYSERSFDTNMPDDVPYIDDKGAMRYKSGEEFITSKMSALEAAGKVLGIVNKAFKTFNKRPHFNRKIKRLVHSKSHDIKSHDTLGSEKESSSPVLMSYRSLDPSDTYEDIPVSDSQAIAEQDNNPKKLERRNSLPASFKDINQERVKEIYNRLVKEEIERKKVEHMQLKKMSISMQEQKDKMTETLKALKEEASLVDKRFQEEISRINKVEQELAGFSEGYKQLELEIEQSQKKLEDMEKEEKEKLHKVVVDEQDNSSNKKLIRSQSMPELSRYAQSAESKEVLSDFQRVLLQKSTVKKRVKEEVSRIKPEDHEGSLVLHEEVEINIMLDKINEIEKEKEENGNNVDSATEKIEVDTITQIITSLETLIVERGQKKIDLKKETMDLEVEKSSLKRLDIKRQKDLDNLDNIDVRIQSIKNSLETLEKEKEGDLTHAYEEAEKLTAELTTLDHDRKHIYNVISTAGKKQIDTQNLITEKKKAIATLSHDLMMAKGAIQKTQGRIKDTENKYSSLDNAISKQLDTLTEKAKNILSKQVGDLLKKEQKQKEATLKESNKLKEELEDEKQKLTDTNMSIEEITKNMNDPQYTAKDSLPYLQSKTNLEHQQINQNIKKLSSKLDQKSELLLKEEQKLQILKEYVTPTPQPRASVEQSVQSETTKPTPKPRTSVEPKITDPVAQDLSPVFKNTTLSLTKNTSAPIDQKKVQQVRDIETEDRDHKELAIKRLQYPEKVQQVTDDRGLMNRIKHQAKNLATKFKRSDDAAKVENLQQNKSNMQGNGRDIYIKNRTPEAQKETRQDREMQDKKNKRKKNQTQWHVSLKGPKKTAVTRTSKNSIAHNDSRMVSTKQDGSQYDRGASTSHDTSNKQPKSVTFAVSTEKSTSTDTPAGIELQELKSENKKEKDRKHKSTRTDTTTEKTESNKQDTRSAISTEKSTSTDTYEEIELQELKSTDHQQEDKKHQSTRTDTTTEKTESNKQDARSDIPTGKSTSANATKEIEFQELKSADHEQEDKKHQSTRTDTTTEKTKDHNSKVKKERITGMVTSI